MTAEYPAGPPQADVSTPGADVNPAGADVSQPAAAPATPSTIPYGVVPDPTPYGVAPDPRSALEAVRIEVAKAVVGQESVVTGLVICLLCRGHALLEGVPGVAKTLLVRSLAGSLALRSARVQFTADLMPGDLTGSLIYDTKTALF